MRQATASDTERTVAHLLVDQVEFANVIVLNKCDLIRCEEGDWEPDDDRPSLAAVTRTIRALNPSAVIVEATQGVVPPAMVLGTKLFSLTQVRTPYCDTRA